MKGPLDTWTDEGTLAELRRSFAHAFEWIEPGDQICRPWLIPHEIKPFRAFYIHSLQFKPFIQNHGYMDTLGFRIGDFAYFTDLLDLSDDAKATLHDLDLWIVGALSMDNSQETHASLKKALAWIDELKPKRLVITHMASAWITMPWRPCARLALSPRMTT